MYLEQTEGYVMLWIHLDLGDVQRCSVFNMILILRGKHKQ